jgi:hypothetical protein
LARLFLVVGMAVFFFATEVVSEADGRAGPSAPAVAERYQPGPLASRVEGRVAKPPDRLQELFGLGVVIAVLYGFRASGLARSSTRGARTSRP